MSYIILGVRETTFFFQNYMANENMADANLADAVRKHPPLYDKKCKEFKYRHAPYSRKVVAMRDQKYTGNGVKILA